uniref:Uncharacterized protein n=1 Tax=Fagus sylvatica TaxID=28930 RepID=A0A2N9J3N9_FAGSY
MAWAWTCTTSCTYLFNYTLLVLLLLGLSSESCYGLGTFGFAIHHRFSDPVKQILGFDGHPEKGSVEYYAAMAHRDRIIRGRHLAASNNQSPLTFANGNDTASWGSGLISRSCATTSLIHSDLSLSAAAATTFRLTTAPKPPPLQDQEFETLSFPL